MDFDPDPIVSFNKLAKIQQFNHDEAEREKLHRDDPVTTKLLHVSVVIAVIAIAFLIFFKLCWDKEKYLRRNPQHDTGGSGSRRSSLGLIGSHPHPSRIVVGHCHSTGVSVENGDRGPVVTALIPESHYHKTKSGGGGGGLKGWVPCAWPTTTNPGSSVQGQKHKRFQRAGFENESYRPSSMSNGV